MTKMSEDKKVNTGRGGKREKVEFTDELIQRVADFAAKGNNAMDVSKEMKLSYPLIRKMMRTPMYQEEIRRATIQQLSSLMGLATKVVKQQLEEGNLDAVKIVYKAFNLLDPEPVQAQKQDTGITIVLPQGMNPVHEVINVSNQVSEERSE
jgi:coenzyme F420-reducing hydrogenase beta subunit